MDYNKSSYKLAEFMQKKLAVNVIKSNASFPLLYPLGPPGVASARRDGIVQKICPLMPINRRQFWNKLHVNGLHDV